MSIIRLKNHHVEDYDDYDSDRYGDADEDHDSGISSWQMSPFFRQKMRRRRIMIVSDSFGDADDEDDGGSTGRQMSR